MAQTVTRPSGAPEGWPEPIHDSEIYSMFLVDQLEYRTGDEVDAVGWDIIYWMGGDYNRLWVETEGQDFTEKEGSEVEKFDVLYGRLFAPFWDFQAGIGYQRIWQPGPDHDRLSAVIGLQGLSPYRFEVDTNLRISEDGDVSADFQATYDIRLTQRLVLQPRFETLFAFQEVEEFGVGQGFNFVGLSARLRYEIRRELAPYLGVTWSRELGETADMAESEGEDLEELALVVGVRFWF
ncbi:MAG: copper resistance protein B [Deltaproteobacteria bacterium]|nr:copper resistance protein B [Deltaproteobacteria bacterium]